MKKKVKIATGAMVEEFRKMKVGESVSFPNENYNSASVRSYNSGNALLKYREKGMSWKTHLNRENKTVIVTRIS